MGLLLTSNTSASALSAGGIIPLGSAIHGKGKNIRLANDTIVLTGTGYFSIDASVSVAVTGTGAETVQLYENGSPIPGAVASATTADAGAVVSLPLTWIIRKSCPCNPSAISIVSSSAGTLSSVSVTVTEA